MIDWAPFQIEMRSAPFATSGSLLDDGPLPHPMFKVYASEKMRSILVQAALSGGCKCKRCYVDRLTDYWDLAYIQYMQLYSEIHSIQGIK